MAAFAISTIPLAASVTDSPKRLRAALLDRASGALHVEPDLAAEEVRRVEAAEHDVRVRDGRLDTAAAVADRPRVGTGALRADPEEATGVDPGDRAAACADLDEVDDRRPHRVAGERHPADPGAGVASDVVVLRDRRPAVLDRGRPSPSCRPCRRRGCRPAERLAEVRRGDHAGRGPGLDHEHRPHGGRVRAEDAAARLHHQQLRLNTRLGEPASRSAAGSARRPAGSRR